MEPQDIKYLIIILECKYALDILNVFAQISSVLLEIHQTVQFRSCYLWLLSIFSKFI